MVEGQLDTHMPKNTFRPLPHTIHTYQLKVNLDLNRRAKTTKVFKENIGINLYDLRSDFLKVKPFMLQKMLLRK